MFAVISRGTTTDPSSVPAGWTLLGKNAGAYGWWLYSRVAVDGEPANYTWEWAAGSATKISIVTYRYGFNPSSPIYDVSNTAYTTLDTTVRAASLLAGDLNSTLLYFGSVAYTTSVALTKPTTQDNTWTADYYEGVVNAGFSHGTGSCEWSGSGATGVIDITAGQSLTTKHAFAVSLYHLGYSPSATPSFTPSVSATPSATPSFTPSVSATPSATPSFTPSASATPSFTPSFTPSASATPSRTPSASPSGSAAPPPANVVVLVPSKNNRISVGVCDCVFW